MSRAARWGLLIVAAAYGALVLGLLASAVLPTARERDFGQEYLLARALWDGVDTNQPVAALADRYVAATFLNKAHAIPHPPTVGLLLLPLGFLPYESAVVVWFVLELLCLLATVACLTRAAPLPLPPLAVPLVALALVAWPPVTVELQLGQLTLPIAALLAGTWAALERRRAYRGGALLGLSLLLKPIAWPWLVWLAWRRAWPVLAAALTVGAAIGAVTVARIGPARGLAYLTDVLPTIATLFATSPANIGLSGLATRLGLPLAALLVPLACLTLALWLTRDLPRGPSLAIMTVASLLGSPLVWPFYLILLLLPLAYVWSRLLALAWPWQATAAAGTAVVLLSLPPADLQQRGELAATLVPLAGTLLLGAVAVSLARRPGAAGHT